MRRAVGTGVVLVVSVWALSSSWRTVLANGPSSWAVAALLAATLLPAAVTWYWGFFGETAP